MTPSSYYHLPPEMLWKVACFVLVFGCCVGSYLNVVIYRLPIPGLSTAKPRRSFCPLCKYQIPVWQNIPILSWILLRGKCANCHEPISPRYIFVELLTGLLFLAAFAHLQWDWRLLAAFTFISLCIAGSYIDMDHQILPHEITWGGTVAGLVAASVIPDYFMEGTWWENLLYALGGAAAGYVLIYLIVQLGKLAFGRLKLSFENPVDWSISQAEGAEEPLFKVDDQEEAWSNIFSRPSDRLIIRAASAKLDERKFSNCILTMSHDSVSVAPQDGGTAETIPLENIKSMSGTCTNVDQPREAMGMGDANWMACVGAFFGWKAVLFTVLAGSMIGAGISLMMILIRRREWAARIPFGPYLASGALIWLFFGPRLLEWYLNLSQGGGDTL